MLQYVKKDLLSVDRGVIAHGCNYHGVMGAGVALLIKRKFPKAFSDYETEVRNYQKAGFEATLLGSCQIVPIIDDQLYIANCYTQGLERVDGQLATPKAIKDSLSKALWFAQNGRLPLYLPKIGAGLGGLSWEDDVEPIVKALADQYDNVDTYVCVYP